MYHWEKLGTGYIGTLCIFLTTSYESIIISIKISMNKKQQQVLGWTQSHWNSHTLPEEMQSSAVTLENDLAVSYKMKLAHTI